MTKKKYGIRTVNGNEPDPETGDVEVSVGGYQDLQEILNKGGSASFNEGKQLISIFDSGDTYVNILSEELSSSKRSALSVYTGQMNLQTTSSDGNQFASIDIEPQFFTLAKTSFGNTTTLRFSNPHSQTNLELPSVSGGGNFLIATTNNIDEAINNIPSPDIQTVVNMGNNLVNKDLNFEAENLNTNISPGQVYLQSKTNGYYTRLYYDGLFQWNGDTDQYSSLKAGAGVFNLPLKDVYGSYTLATTDDCVPYTGAVNDLNMGGKVIKVGLNDATPATVTTLGYSNGLSGFVSDSPGAKVIYDMQRIEALDKGTGFKKYLFFNASAGKKDYIVSLPNKDGELATTDHIAVSNNTSTALSCTFLNETYPDALVGFQVICDSLLSSGGEHTIYVKSQTGWLKILGEPVP